MFADTLYTGEMCSADPCDAPHYAKGLCKKHYDRQRRRGTLFEWDPPATPTCSISGCSRTHYANGICKLHYDRVRKRGTTDRRDAAQRFEGKVQRTSSCWKWTGARNAAGYGRFRSTTKRTVAAHRFAYELWVGKIPYGLHIDHVCGNTSCVNQSHLEPVTQAENNRRASERTKAA